MDIVQFMNLLNDIEDRFPVDKWIMGRIHIWPLLRRSLFCNYYQTCLYGSQSQKNIYNLYKNACKVFNGLVQPNIARLLDHNKTLKSDRDYDVLALNYDANFLKIDGFWYSKIMDPFISFFKDKNVSCFLLSAGFKCHIPRLTPSRFIQSNLVINRMIGLLKDVPKFSDEQLYGIDELQSYLINAKLPINNLDLNKIRRYVYQIESISQYFCKIINRIKPRLVLLSCYYSTESMAMVLACNYLGVPSVDVQHGLQGDAHYAYGRWNKVPPCGYELLPTYFWCWSEFEAKSINNWNKSIYEKHRAINGGNLFLHQWQNDNSNLVNLYNEKIRKLKKDAGGCIYVLFTLQVDSKQNIERVILLLKTIEKSNNKIFFFIRLHPCFLNKMDKIKKMLKREGLSNYDVDHATNYPLYAILRNVDVHVTDSSSTVIEAEQFGVPSVILSNEGSALFPEHVWSGWAVYENSNGEIIDGIIAQNNRKFLLPRVSKDSFVQSERALMFLYEIIKGR